MSAHQRGSPTRWLLWFPCVYPPTATPCQTWYYVKGSLPPCRLWPCNGPSAVHFFGIPNDLLPPWGLSTSPISFSLFFSNIYSQTSPTIQSEYTFRTFATSVKMNGHLCNNEAFTCRLAGQLLYEWIHRSSWVSTSKCRLSAISEMSICQGEDND